MARETSTTRTTDTVPAPGPEDRELAGDPPTAAEPVAAARPVPFERLLSVAVLSPAQASLLAVQLLDVVPADVQLSDVLVGRVALTATGDLTVGHPYAGDGRPVTDLLQQLLQNARRLPAHPRPEQLQVLRALEETAHAPLLAAGTAARRLDEAVAAALGPRARQRLVAQLAALVTAFAHVAHVAPDPEDVPDSRDGAGSLEPAGAATRPRSAVRAPAGPSAADAPAEPVAVPPRAAPTGDGPRRPPRRRALVRRRPRGRRLGLVALVLAVVVAGSGYVLLRNGGSDLVGLGDGGSPSSPSAPAPTPRAKKPAKQPKPAPTPAVPALARTQAGAVTGVAVQKNGTCRPGGLCPVTVTVRFRPASTSRTVTWKVGAARVCRRAIAWSAPVSVTAQPGWTRVYASSSVRVPAGRTFALVALTTTPARAQSPAVPVAGASLRC